MQFLVLGHRAGFDCVCNCSILLHSQSYSKHILQRRNVHVSVKNNTYNIHILSIILGQLSSWFKYYYLQLLAVFGLKHINDFPIALKQNFQIIFDIKLKCSNEKIYLSLWPCLVLSLDKCLCYKYLRHYQVTISRASHYLIGDVNCIK